MAAVVGLVLTGPTARASLRAGQRDVGVSSRSIVVAGIVAETGARPGADLGARARFRRANLHKGVAGHRIDYRGTTSDGGDAARDRALVAQVAMQAFAIVPASSPVLDTETLARGGVPFFGAADTVGWNGNQAGFGFTGAQAALQTNVVSPAWGVQLAALLGDARRATVSIATDADAAGAARATQAGTSLRAAGFRVVPPVNVPLPTAAIPDLAPVATRLMSGSPAAVLLLTAPATSTAIARQLAAEGFTGTVGTGESFYQPTLPAVAAGMTVLVPYAPLEQSTAANRRLVADVRAVDPGAAITPAVVGGYWAADQFLSALANMDGRVSRARLLASANSSKFRYRVPGTVGPSTWPAMHSQPVPCGALVQSDGTRYYVAEPYRCSSLLVTKRRRH